MRDNGRNAEKITNEALGDEVRQQSPKHCEDKTRVVGCDKNKVPCHDDFMHSDETSFPFRIILRRLSLPARCPVRASPKGK